MWTYEKDQLTGAASWSLEQGFSEIQTAAKRIEGYIRRTPMLQAQYFHQTLGLPPQLFLKLEQLQITGSFKPRGVFNRVLSAPPEFLQNGLIAASGGNHGQAVAYVAHQMNMSAQILVPSTTPTTKIDRIRSWGAEVMVVGENMGESIERAQQLALESDRLMIHPFGDTQIIYGQGTLALEIFQDLAQVDALVIAIGGGGMISGIALAARFINPQIKIYGVEPMGCPTLFASLEVRHIIPVQHIATRAGTLAVRETLPLNFSIIQELVDQVVLVSDDEMQKAAAWLWNELSIAAELSGAASMAAILCEKFHFKPTDRVCTIICGAGLDGI